MVGMVIGIGVFKAPALVAARLDEPFLILGLWAVGGLVALIGALCYAELASNYPDAGGEYHFLARAFGPGTGFLFAWGRLAVVQTGAIAAVAYVFGDYAQQILPLGSAGPALYAALAVIALTALNIDGTRISARVQGLLAVVLTISVFGMAVLGFVFHPGGNPAEPAVSLQSVEGGNGAVTAALGFAMIFVMLTYGGWNETVYLAAELRDARRTVIHILVWGTTLIAVLYVSLNAAYLYVLGPAAMRASDAIGADYMRRVFGPSGAVALSVIVIVAALTTLNATIFTGARSAYAMGRDVRLLGWLGRWSDRAQGPVNAHLIQAGLVLGLIAIGAAARQGFAAMVEYTAPVFWFFLLLVGIALFVLRRDTRHGGGFRVPFYPVTPILFCASSLFMLHAALSHTGIGALLGVGALALGEPVWMLARRRG